MESKSSNDQEVSFAVEFSCFLKMAAASNFKNYKNAEYFRFGEFQEHQMTHLDHRQPLAIISSQLENIENGQNDREINWLSKRSKLQAIKKKLDFMADEESEEQPENGKEMNKADLTKLVLANLERINDGVKRDEPICLEPPNLLPLRSTAAKKAISKQRKLGQPIEPIFRKQKSQKRDLERRDVYNTRHHKKIKSEHSKDVDSPIEIEC